MDIEFVENKQGNQISVSELKPGTVYKTKNEVSFLKLEDNKSVILTFATGEDWFCISDGSIEDNQPPITVLGHLVGIKVRHNG